MRIILDVHGHSHMAARSQMARTAILGPGSLGYNGEWSELVLEKLTADSSWATKEMKFLNN